MGKIDAWVPKIPRLKNAKVSRFSYRDAAYTNDDIEGVENYDYARNMNVPSLTKTDTEASVLDAGARAQFSSLSKNALNHFFGRVSYNLNKVIDFLSDFLDDFIAFQETNETQHATINNNLSTLQETNETQHATINNNLSTLQTSFTTTVANFLATLIASEGNTYIPSDLSDGGRIRVINDSALARSIISNPLSMNSRLSFNIGPYTILEFQRIGSKLYCVNKPKELVWTNPYPTVSFAPQYASIPNMKQYKTIIIEFKDNISNNYYCTTSEIVIRSLANYVLNVYSPPSELSYAREYVLNDTYNAVEFMYGLFHSGSAYTIDNTACVPTRIYGIK